MYFRDSAMWCPAALASPSLRSTRGGRSRMAEAKGRRKFGYRDKRPFTVFLAMSQMTPFTSPITFTVGKRTKLPRGMKN